MRWLLIHPGPNFSVADVHNGWAEALRGLGEEVMEFNMDARLTFYDSALIGKAEGVPDDEGRYPVRKALTTEQAIDLAADGIFSECYRKWPHVVLCVSAFFTPPFVLEVLRARKHKIVMLFTESPYQDDMQLKMAEYATLSLVNDPQNIGRYREIGPAEYMPHSYRPSVHHPAGPGAEPEHDLAFVGTGFPSRVKFFEQMNLDGLDVVLGGFWGTAAADSPLRQHLISRQDGEDACVDNADTADLYRTSRTGINLYRREAEDTWDRRPGPRDPARSRWPRAACGSPATRAAKATSCSRCSRRSPARKRQASRSGGPSRTPRNGPGQRRRPARPSRNGRSRTRRSGCCRCSNKQPRR